jgi:DNA-binding response OmpR family regulator
MTNYSEIMPARLVAVAADVRPDDLVLDRESVAIGRSPLADVVVPRNTISRIHARITREGPRYLLADAGSANGTFVNGQVLHGPHLLSNNDAIGLGDGTTILRFIDPDPTVSTANRLRYDERTLSFSLAGQPLELTPNQLRLLLHLYQQRGQVVSRESCAEAIWGREYDPGLDADALDRVVSNLRGILRKIDPASELLQTRRGLGYLLQEN